jgi:uroporphyrinogen-III decarboxylase
MEKTPEQLYQEREQRVYDAIQLKEPDRVPIVCFMGAFPIKYGGISAHDAMFDYDKNMKAWLDTYQDFEPDMVDDGFMECFWGHFLESLDYKALKWPGHGLSKEASHHFQFVEKEYMTADEYDDFIFDPTDFMIRKFWPRAFGILEPLKDLAPLNQIFAYYIGSLNFFSFADPEIWGAMEKLHKAALAAQEMIKGATEQLEKLIEMGFPPHVGAGTQAPFDTISDYLRGTKGAMLDMFRCPDKLLAAINKMLPLMLNLGLFAKVAGVPRVFIPLHKGLDGFMSPDQFKTFYWPSLKKLIEGLMAEDLTPILFWEGDCTSRLEIIGDIPKGKAVYYFERTDIFKAKEVLGDVVCIRGNVPLSMLNSGTVDDIKAYCKKLIDKVGKGGGFIMDCSTEAADAKPENLKAMFDFTKEYGIYGE